MNRVCATLFIAALLAASAPASASTLSTGQVNLHSYGSWSTQAKGDACPDDVFFVTATLTLKDPSPGDQVALLVDHAGPKPLGIANAMSPVTTAMVQLGGCDRSFTAAVVGLVVVDSLSYTLTFS